MSLVRINVLKVVFWANGVHELIIDTLNGILGHILALVVSHIPVGGCGEGSTQFTLLLVHAFRLSPDDPLALGLFVGAWAAERSCLAGFVALERGSIDRRGTEVSLEAFLGHFASVFTRMD